MLGNFTFLYYIHCKVVIHAYIVMFQEFIKTVKEAGIDEITSSQSSAAPVKHKPFNVLDRFKQKNKKEGG